MTDRNATPFHLTGRTILITGASSGIGRACAVAVSKLGANVLITGRNRERLDETLTMLDGDGHTVLTADLVIASERAALVDALPRLDGVVHSAGLAKLRPVAYVDERSLSETTSIDMYAPLLLTTAMLKNKKVENGASIVFISSISGVVGVVGLMSYAASKAALLGAARVLAVELSARKIRVNCVSPGMVSTPMAGELDRTLGEEVRRTDEARYPLGYGLPEDVANTVTFLLSPASRWITGTNVVLDGGYTMTR